MTDLIAKALNELRLGTSHLLDNWSQQVIAIQGVQKGPARLLAFHQTMLNEAIEDVLDTRIGSSGTPGQLPATPWHG